MRDQPDGRERWDDLGFEVWDLRSNNMVGFYTSVGEAVVIMHEGYDRDGAATLEGVAMSHTSGAVIAQTPTEWLALFRAFTYVAGYDLWWGIELMGTFDALTAVLEVLRSREDLSEYRIEEVVGEGKSQRSRVLASKPETIRVLLGESAR